MTEFIFKMPTKIVFGENAILRLDSIIREFNAEKVFIVTDKFLETTDCFNILINNLKDKGLGLTVYTDIIPEPPVDVVDKAVEALKESGCEIVVAVGGGSSIDICKAICMLKNNEGSVRDYLFGGTKKVVNPSLPLIVVPTTAGSGSEVTAASVISDDEKNVKLSVTHEYLIPKIAVIDPIMQVGMPAIITASTGMDALTHAIEAYVSKNASLLSDMYAEKAIEIIGKNIYTATYTPNNLEARSNMALASLIAAASFANGGLGAVHGISQAMGGVAHVAHGIANSMLLPYVMEKNMVGNLYKFNKIAALLGENVEGMSIREGAIKAVEKVKQMAIDLMIPSKLSQVDVKREMFPDIVKGTMEYRLLPLNPVIISEEDVYDILEKAM